MKLSTCLHLHTAVEQGYCQLQTTKGNINVEIHCDIVPRMAENFLGLCVKGYYDGTKFHRSIRNFMLQVNALLNLRRGEPRHWQIRFCATLCFRVWAMLRWIRLFW